MRDRLIPLDCGTCEYWLSRHVANGMDPAAAARAHEAAIAAGSPVPEGHCRRHPRAEPMHRTDLCGAHSTLEAERRRELAKLIAVELKGA